MDSFQSLSMHIMLPVSTQIGNTKSYLHIDSSCNERLAALVCSAPAGCMQDLGLEAPTVSFKGA